MSIERYILTSTQVNNIVGTPAIINVVRICAHRAAGTIAWPSDGNDLKLLLKIILNEPENRSWLNAVLTYVVNNNPQIDWEHYTQDVANIEPEIYAACLAALYGISGQAIPGSMEITYSTPEDLDESNIDGAVLRLRIFNTQWTDRTLVLGNFTLPTAPPGVSVASVTYVCENQADIELAYDGTDWDDECPLRLRARVAAAEVESAQILTTGYVRVAAVEEAVAAASLPLALTESTLNGAEITLTLTNEEFEESLTAGNFTLNNEPAGLTVDSVIRNSATSATIILAFSGDFDASINNFSVTIAGTELTRGNALTTEEMSITAVAESASIASTPDPLTEGNLNGAEILITLTNETFEAVLDEAQFTLDNAPAGVTKSVTRLTDTTARLTLVFDGTDFDADINDFGVTIGGSQLSRGTAIAAANVLVISRLLESVAINTTPTPLTEANLNGADINLTLTGESFNSSLDEAEFTLNNAPAGVTKSVTRLSDTTARLTLVFDGTDFDADVTDFSVTVGGSQLSRGNPLTTPEITIAAVIE